MAALAPPISVTIIFSNTKTTSPYTSKIPALEFTITSNSLFRHLYYYYGSSLYTLAQTYTHHSP